MVRRSKAKGLNLRSANGPGNVEGEGVTALSGGEGRCLEGGPLAATGDPDVSARDVAGDGNEKNGCDDQGEALAAREKVHAPLIGRKNTIFIIKIVNIENLERMVLYAVAPAARRR